VELEEQWAKIREPNIMLHIRAANIMPNWSSSLKPERLWASFRAGNLKNIQRYMEPSKANDAAPRPRRRLSVLERLNLVRQEIGRGFLGLTFPDDSEATLDGHGTW